MLSYGFIRNYVNQRLLKNVVFRDTEEFRMSNNGPLGGYTEPFRMSRPMGYITVYKANKQTQ